MFSPSPLAKKKRIVRRPGRPANRAVVQTEQTDEEDRLSTGLNKEITEFHGAAETEEVEQGVGSSPILAEYLTPSNAAIICMILGANPPMTVFEGFIKRTWGHLGIVQIARMTRGMVMVRFNDEATRNEVLDARVVQFDRKPVITRLQYWENKNLSVLVSTVGKPIMVDRHTKDFSRVQFARILIEMDILDNPPKSFQYVNEFAAASLGVLV
uniref:DUF4283 domain-containing protein n=1 Tax=Cannabis sativa TaxID=3483 RepID=A0A803NIK4_CANSA